MEATGTSPVLETYINERVLRFATICYVFWAYLCEAFDSAPVRDNLNSMLTVNQEFVVTYPVRSSPSGGAAAISLLPSTVGVILMKKIKVPESV